MNVCRWSLPMDFFSQYKHPEVWLLITLLDLRKGMKSSTSNIFQALEQWETPAHRCQTVRWVCYPKCWIHSQKSRSSQVASLRSAVLSATRVRGTTLLQLEESWNLSFAAHTKHLPYFLEALSVRTPTLKWLKHNSNIFYTGFCILLCLVALRQQIFPLLLCQWWCAALAAAVANGDCCSLRSRHHKSAAAALWLAVQ